MGLETLLLAAAGTQAVGGILAGVEGMGAARYNVRAAEAEADLARRTAGLEADRISREGRRVVGAQRVAAAASGVDVSQGSPLLAMLATIRESAEDATLARWRGKVRAEQSLAEARLQRQAGRRALIGGLLDVGKTGLNYGLMRTVLGKRDTRFSLFGEPR